MVCRLHEDVAGRADGKEKAWPVDVNVRCVSKPAIK